jgi:16S rRNA (cytosine1402-N4)-methyltransferase
MAEGLAGDFAHLPVMAAEVTDLLTPVPTGLVVDATVGGGGHSRLLLTARPDLRLLGIDRDPAAVAGGSGTRTLRGSGPHRAGRLRKSPKHRGKRGNRGDLVRPGRQQPAARPSGAGFSYWADAAPLDMRMDSARR